MAPSSRVDCRMTRELETDPGSPIYQYTLGGILMQSTTVKVSKVTVKKLSALQHSLHAKSLDDTIELLVKQHRKELLSKAFGADRGKISSFDEDDRGEDRN